MTEAHIGLIYNAAFKFPLQNRSHKILKSYYLMRCQEISKGISLPEKYFSTKERCSHCYLEWGSGTKAEVRSRKLSKKQRRKIRLKHINKNINENNQQNERILKELELICSFCKNKTVESLTRPKREKRNEIEPVFTENNIVRKVKSNIPTKIKPQQAISEKKKDIKETRTNLYENTRDIFSMNNKNNILSSTINKTTKVIKNNKKKKDKFAGLCQKAVLASVKLKEEQKKQNKLNLFLKPSL